MRRLLLVVALAACVAPKPGTDRRDLGPDEDRGLRELGVDRPELGVDVDAGHERGDGPDAGGGAVALYGEVVGSCARGWTLVAEDDFDGTLADGWEPSPAPWRIESGELRVDMMNSASYWDRHLVRKQLAAEQIWVRVDLNAERGDNWPQLHLRISAAAPTERFFGVRLRGDLAGIQLVRQSAPSDHTNPEAQRIFDVNLAFARFHRLVASARTLPDGRVHVTAGIYDPREDPPRFKTDSFVEHTYASAEAYGAGSFALSGWEGVSRFDTVRAYACD